MANRYWVGGTGDWSDTAHWSTSSGGSSGASVPTSSDNAFFDGNSGTGVSSVVPGSSTCANLDCTGYSGTLSTTTWSLAVYGNLTFSAGMTFTPGTQAVSVYAPTSTTATVTSAGKTFYGFFTNGLVFGYFGTVQLSGSLTANSVFLQSDFSTASNTVTTTGNFEHAYGTLTINSSTLNVGALFKAAAGYTVTTSSSTINAAGIAGGGYTYNIVNLSGTGGSITGANTFTTLNISAPASTGTVTYTFDSNQTITTFVCAGASYTQRIFLCSASRGSAVTLAVTTYSSKQYLDFRDITASGGTPWTGTSLGNAGGNTNITFDAAKTVYWNLAGTQNWSSTGWATTAGGSPAAANFPLAQDTATFTNTGSAGTVTVDAPWLVGTLDMGGRTSGMTLTISNLLYILSNVSIATGITWSGSGSFFLVGTTSGATQTFTSNGATIGLTIYVVTPGTVQLADAFTASIGLVVSQGTFNANNFAVTLGAFGSLGTSTRTVTMGSGLWTLTAYGGVWQVTNTGLTLNKNTANILLTDTSNNSRQFTGGGFTYNKLTIGGATGISTLTFSGNNTFSEMASTKTVAHTLQFTSGSTTTTALWNITGTSGNVVTIAATAASPATLVSTSGNAVSTDYMSISYSTASPVNAWFAGTHSTNGGNNTNWYFTAPTGTTASMLMMFK
jgi:hypothetical protein